MWQEMKITDRVERLLGSFDFDKLAIAMNAVDWKHCDKPVNAEGLKKFATSLLEWAYENKGVTSSGGFCAEWDDGELMLDFTFDAVIESELYE